MTSTPRYGGTLLRPSRGYGTKPGHLIVYQAMDTVKRLQTRVERIPIRLRIWSIGATGTIYLLCGLAIARLEVPPAWKWGLFVGWFASLAIFVVLANEVTTRLTPHTRSRLFTLRNITSVAGYLGLTAFALWALTVDRASGMILFVLVAFANYFIAGGGSEQLIPLKQLHARITQRVAFRIIAIAAATLALALFLITTRTASDQQNTNFNFVMGMFLTAGGASLKVHSRARKLCTQINGQARSLILALDSLTSTTADQANSQANSARREWLKLSQMLDGRIETGLPLHSTALLPAPNRHRLQALVNMALVDTPRGTLFFSQARAELCELAAACAPRNDTTL
ncbi:hypothetical protein [Streptomyces rhizosphaericus]|uniref:Uncharacterized protein n=1 Tax=Streptomyces rhizosphaericus TaxID=114699 RepID=A0A6G4AH48_9ACTN|nr:hypothetical protein [Streptomyces rhizosphaericus]NEW72558.1 hypothetical protein [Streptomyces rhizosphaericus]